MRYSLYNYLKKLAYCTKSNLDFEKKSSTIDALAKMTERLQLDWVKSLNVVVFFSI